MAEKKLFTTFAMSETTVNQLREMAPEMRLRFYDAISDFGISGIEPDFTGLEKIIWIPMRDLILSMKKSDEEWHKKQSNNGKKGAEKRWGGDTIIAPPSIDSTAIEEIAPPSIDSHKEITITNKEKEKKDNSPIFVFSDSKIKEPKKPDPPIQEKPPEIPETSPPDPEPHQNDPAKSKEDATAVFNKARKLSNELKIFPECRDLIIPPAKHDCLTTFQNYSWAEIENALRNFHWHNTGKCGPGWKPPPGYQTLYGFLINDGVMKYADDETVKRKFKEVKNAG
ncbi:hypothetical protein AGMMS49940_21880 [Spirochaetia bacterium]|nr:hypothetical protein AGMMS49940_21880 [Spirochaetia bacterium]